MTRKEFNELVYEYGASGCKVVEEYNEAQRGTVAQAWETSKNEFDADKCDEIINSFYKEFIDNGDTFTGYGYHGSKGRPLKEGGRKQFKNMTISGSPAEIEQIQNLAAAANKTISRYVIDSVLNK